MDSSPVRDHSPIFGGRSDVDVPWRVRRLAYRLQSEPDVPVALREVVREIALFDGSLDRLGVVVEDADVPTPVPGVLERRRRVFESLDGRERERERQPAAAAAAAAAIDAHAGPFGLLRENRSVGDVRDTSTPFGSRGTTRAMELRPLTAADLPAFADDLWIPFAEEMQQSTSSPT